MRAGLSEQARSPSGALRLPRQRQHRQRRQPGDGAGLAEVPLTRTWRCGASPSHQRGSRQVRCPVGAVGMAFAGSGRQPSDGDIAQAARPAARHPSQLRAGRLGGRGHRPGHGCTRGVTSAFGPGACPLALSHGSRLPATPSALCAARRRSGMGGESAHQAANVATVRLATHVSYRDLASAAAMARAGAREPEAIAPDLAFAHPAPTLADAEPGRLVVGVMAYYGRGDDPVRGAEVRRRYVATMAEALAQVTDQATRWCWSAVTGRRRRWRVTIRAAVLASVPRPARRRGRGPRIHDIHRADRGDDAGRGRDRVAVPQPDLCAPPRQADRLGRICQQEPPPHGGAGPG